MKRAPELACLEKPEDPISKVVMLTYGVLQYAW
jgi:hypothetical protein